MSGPAAVSIWRARTPPFPSGRGQAAHRLYAHLLWTTAGRVPVIRGASRRAAAESRLIALCRAVDVEPVEVCVLPDRVHLLIRFKPLQALDEIALRLRRASEEGLREAGLRLRWGPNWAAVTVGPDEVRRIRRRIARRGEEPD